MLTAMVILVVGAFVLTLFAAKGKVDLWIPVLLLCIIEALHWLPQGR